MSKKKRPEYVKIECQKVLDRIEEELIKPEPKLSAQDIENGNYEVPKKILLIARKEIKKMMEVLDKNRYTPTFTYPLFHNCRKKTELSELLLRIEYIYIEYT
ncbi:hypothetical protein IX293_002320 [Fusobacterium necrophorum]|uniref:Uncharacterized protein n=1 Tax=Fusobacterium necrophorum BL TaxID=1441732 RepID=A0AB73BTR1_9FUSO|nr:hypothetical protein [Fusobacterium necrophorum]KDE61228.1 hypothetical protein FUSO3_10740 [Fusobacterium necrophorum BL]KDE70813.1 hypothetical protein FUSO7_10320 [Fusobacterium necrophorum BFTR-2]MBR8824043.1 hypothetical protein [Fusobacterium necrophorum]